MLVPVGAVLATRSGDGGSSSPTVAPSSNKATNQGGLNGADTEIAAPIVTSSYDATTQVLTFTWPGPAAGTTSYGYAYLLYTPADRNPALKQTFETKITATTPDPASVCVRVGAVQSNGKNVTGDQVCGTR